MVALGLRGLVYDDRMSAHGLVPGVNVEWKHMGEHREGLCR